MIIARLKSCYWRNKTPASITIKLFLFYSRPVPKWLITVLKFPFASLSRFSACSFVHPLAPMITATFKFEPELSAQPAASSRRTPKSLGEHACRALEVYCWSCEG